MAEQKIKVKVHAEWANINELMAELDAALATRKTKSGKPLPKSKEVISKESEVRSRRDIIKSKMEAGISPKEMSQDFTDFFLSFKELILSLLTATQAAKDEVSKLNKEVTALETRKNVKESQLTSTLKKGILHEDGTLTSTKKARKDAMRELAIPNRSGGRGEFYTTTDPKKLESIQAELAARATKILANPNLTDEDKKKAADLNTDAKRIGDAQKMLADFDKNLNQQYLTLTTAIKELTVSIQAKKIEAFDKYEKLDTPESDIEVQGLGSSVMKVQGQVDDVVKEDRDEEREEAQKDNKVSEERIELQNKERGSINKLVTSFFGYQMALRALRKLWNDAIQTVKKLDAALTQQAIVSSLNRKEAWDLIRTYQNLAKQTGMTTTAIAEVATKYFQQGKTTKEVMILTEAAAKSARIAGINATQAVDYLTTALNGFQLAAEQAVLVSDKFAALAADSATDYEELAIALSKVASQANLAGMSINYTLGLLAKGIETTREPAESIGTALKTIVARMRELTDYGATLEDGMSLNNVEKQLQYINIELRNEQGSLRSTEEVLDELGKRWDTLTANQQAAMAKALAGTRQQARLIAMMSDYERTLELVAIAGESAGATAAQHVEYMQSLEASQTRLATAYEALITALVNNDMIKAVLDFLAQILERIAAALSSGDKSELSIARKITSWAALLGMIAALLVPLMTKTVRDIKQIFLSLTKTKEIEAEKLRLLIQQNLQRQLALELLKQEYLQSKQNAGTLTDAEKADFAKVNQNVDQLKKDAEASKTIGGALSTKTGAKEQKIQANAAKVQTAMMIIAGAIAVISFVIDSIKRIQNAATEAAAEVIEKNTKLQAEIYENNQIINTVDKLTDSFDKLNKKLIKTSADWDEIEEIRQQLLEQFKAEERQSMENMRVEEIVSLSKTRAKTLEQENAKKLAKMEKNMKKASGKADWGGNILAGAGAGAALGAGIGTAVGGWAMGLGTVVGLLGGAYQGAIGGVVVSIAQQIEKSNSEKIIKKMLKSEEGLAQARYLYSEQFKAITKDYGDESIKMRSFYQTLLQTLDAKELEKVLLKSGMTAQEYAANMAKIMSGNLKDISILTGTTSTYSEKIDALNKLLGSDMPAEMKDGLKSVYGEYLDIAKQFPTTVGYLDKFGWSVDQLNEFLKVMDGEKLNADQWMKTIGTVLSGTGTVQEKLASLGGSMTGLSSDAMSAIADLVLAGRTLQTMSELQTQTSARVKNIRESQSKWDSMTVADQSNFVAENMGLFMTDGQWDQTKFDNFVSGMDITEMLNDYMVKEQDDMVKQYDEVLLGLGLELQAKQQELKEALVDPKKTKEDIENIKKAIENLEGEIAAATYMAEKVPTMFNLTLDEMIKKQQEQISVYKEMLEAEKKALIESLEDRKEAYQDYFDAIKKEYDTQDYEEQKAKLESQILKLTGATDAESMMKRAELESSLKDLEKERSQTLRDNAQTAVLESIDTQIENTNDKYDEMLENDDKMLSEMRNSLEVDKAAYELQYWNYLQTLGLTEEAKQQRFRDFQTTFSGGIAATGVPYIPNISTPNPSAPTTPETQNNYSFKINDRVVDFTKAETTALNELLRTALKRVGITLNI